MPDASNSPLDETQTAAPDAAAHHLARAVETIDAAFGAGYASQNPQLLASMIRACAIEAAVGADRDAYGRALPPAHRGPR